MKEQVKQNTKIEFPKGIQAYGTDSLRITLLSMNSNNQYLKFEIDKLENNRNFCNKLWNASRYIIIHSKNTFFYNNKRKKNHIINIWICSIWEQYKNIINKYNKEYRFDVSIKLIKSFIKDQFCDWYLEFSKYLLLKKYDLSQETKVTMVTVLEEILRTLHPFIPFITEELWQKIKILLSKDKKSIMISSYPKFEYKRLSKYSLLKINFIKSLIKKIRMMRSQLNIKNNKSTIIFIENINISCLCLIKKILQFFITFYKITKYIFYRKTYKNKKCGTELYK